jgi:hypothetical protein
VADHGTGEAGRREDGHFHAVGRQLLGHYLPKMGRAPTATQPT